MTTTNQIQIDVHDLNIDPTLVGATMRDELVIFYNKLVHWSEEHGKNDAEKKSLENMLEEAKDRARAIRAAEAEAKGIKAKIQEAYIKDIWDVPIEVLDTSTGEVKKTTCSHLMARFSIALQNETNSRHKMNLCISALDIGRTAVSFDKIEITKMGGVVT